MTGAARIRGWCPGAWQPMQSGDGLIVWVRPRQGRLTAAQALGLCQLAERHGNGIIELTSRANVQLRGLRERDHPTLLEGLSGLGLLDDDPATEARRNIIVTPFWHTGDRTDRISLELAERLGELPDLPAKFGFAVDLGPRPVLCGAPADIRLEPGEEGAILLRADGARTGRRVGEADAVDHAIALAHWFATHASTVHRRMRDVLQQIDPESFVSEMRAEPGDATPAPGRIAQGVLAGIAFGQTTATELSRAITDTGCVSLTITPWRMLCFDGAQILPADPFVTRPGDPSLAVDACPGAPHCSGASVETRGLAMALAQRGVVGLHVSGCAKGCARRRPAALTLVGREGRFDLVENGSAWEEPSQRGLRPEDVIKRFG